MIIVNMIFRCFIVNNPLVYVNMYKSIVLSRIMYCSPVWEPHHKKYIAMLEGVQSKFLKRLRWRCNLSGANIKLPSITDLFYKQNIATLKQLKNAGLIANFFNVRHNRLRSGCTITPKEVARTELINNIFAWRLTRLVLVKNIPLTHFGMFVNQ